MADPQFKDATEEAYNRLPEVYRIQDEVQNIPRPLPEIQELRNYVTNPVPANAVGYWHTPEVSTLSYESGRLKLVYTGASGMSTLAPPTEVIPAELGDTAWVVLRYQGPGKFAVIVHHRDKDGNILNQNVEIMPNSPAAETWVRIKVDVTHPATTNLYLAQLMFGNTFGSPNGETHYLRNILFTKNNNNTAPTYFDGGTIAPAENMVPNPSLEENITGYVGSNVSITRSDEWSDDGDWSLKVVATGGSSDSFVSIVADIGGVRLGLELGKTYTVAATIHVPAPLTEPTSIERSIAFFYKVDGVYSSVGTGKAPLGTSRLNLTFTVPANATEAFIRLYHGGKGGAVYWDRITLGEGTEVVPYGDRDVRYPVPAYGWNGTPHSSTSFQTGFADDPGGMPLKRFMSVIGDQVDDVQTLYERFNYLTLDSGGAADSTADLVDPATADADWLPWIAQMLGAGHNFHLRSVSEQRQLLSEAHLAYRAGNAEALAATAQAFLTGSKYVSVYDHTTNVSAIGAAGQWDVLIVTRSSETSMNSAQLLAAIRATGNKPAGIVLWHRTFDPTWATLEATYTTWQGYDNAPNWQRIEETGV